MTDASVLVERCRALGAAFIPVGERLKVRAPSPLPEHLVAQLRAMKKQVLEVIEQEQHRTFGCWVLEEWRRVSIPDWRRILQESIHQGDTEREEYARWMLREVLLDPDYEETAA